MDEFIVYVPREKNWSSDRKCNTLQGTCVLANTKVDTFDTLKNECK